jgi:hypothetical protein
MDSSITFARVLGIVFLVGGLNALINRKAMSAAVDGVAENAGLLWTWGFVNLLLRAAIVALQNVWVSGWRILIPICGWAALVKGIWIILLPGSAKAVYRKSNKPSVLIFGGVVAMIFAVMLLYAGFEL